MARLTRVTQSLFASNAAGSQLSVFGSLAAGSPQLIGPGSPAVIQSGTAQYLGGWFSAVINDGAPAIEDMNALFYLLSYQLGYILQQGMPEWDAATVYYTNNFVSQSGSIYKSLQDNNLGNSVSVGSYWEVFSSGGGGGANDTLSNLGSPLAMNSSILFDGSEQRDIGVNIAGGGSSTGMPRDVCFWGGLKTGYQPTGGGNFNVSAHMYLIGVTDMSSGDAVINLLDAGTFGTGPLIIKDETGQCGSPFSIVVNAPDFQLIDGGTQVVLSSGFSRLELYCNGNVPGGSSTWLIISKGAP